jgi:hypothetical protein
MSNVSENSDRFLALRWLMLCTLYFSMSWILYVLDYAITQPHYAYNSFATWSTIAVREGVAVSLEVTVVIGVLVPIGLVVQRSPRDLDYYPHFGNSTAVFHSLGSRLILISGGLLLAGYLAAVAIELWESSQRPHGLIWPGHYIYGVLMTLWGVLWMADCLTRPRRGSIVAAILFTVLAVLYPLSIGTAYTVE